MVAEGGEKIWSWDGCRVVPEAAYAARDSSVNEVLNPEGLLQLAAIKTQNDFIINSDNR